MLIVLTVGLLVASFEFILRSPLEELSLEALEARKMVSH